jgi:hypothetical protein
MGEQCSLLTHIAATVNDFIVRADEKLTVFIELELGDSHLRRIANLHRKRFSIISKAAQAKTSSIWQSAVTLFAARGAFRFAH